MQKVVCLISYRLDIYIPLYGKESSPDQQPGNKASPDIPAHSIVPAKLCYQGRQNESREERDADIVLVLEDNDCAGQDI